MELVAGPDAPRPVGVFLDEAAGLGLALDLQDGEELRYILRRPDGHHLALVFESLQAGQVLGPV